MLLMAGLSLNALCLACVHDRGQTWGSRSIWALQPRSRSSSDMRVCTGVRVMVM